MTEKDKRDLGDITELAHEVHNTEEEIEPMDAYTHLKEIVAYCSRRLAEFERFFSPSPKKKRTSNSYETDIPDEEEPEDEDEPESQERDWAEWNRKFIEGFTGIKSK